MTADVERLVTLQQKDTFECDTRRQALANRTKELRTARNKLLLEAGQSPAVADCEVTPWLAVELCSAKCGGGTKNLTRTILRNPDGGVSCPKLVQTVECNRYPCHVDCKMGDWSAWANCSAPCGGGQRSRDRAILQNAENGGQPCKVKKELKACNVRQCKDACDFGDWGAWGYCTKACGGGQRGRRRGPLDHSGLCPATENFEFKQCNAIACPAKLQCATRMELVVLVDGSELMDRTSFGHQIHFATELVGRLNLSRDNASSAGAVIYGTGLTPEKVSSPLTDNAADLQNWLNSVQTGKGPLKLEAGLAEAGRMLRSGNSDLPSTVLILLDGRPDSIYLARHQSKLLQDHGVRVVLAAVGQRLDSDMLSDLVSPPAVENIFIAPSFEALKQTIATTLAGLCPSGRFKGPTLAAQTAGAAASESPLSPWYLPPAAAPMDS